MSGVGGRRDVRRTDTNTAEIGTACRRAVRIINAASSDELRSITSTNIFGTSIVGRKSERSQSD